MTKTKLFITLLSAISFLPLQSLWSKETVQDFSSIQSLEANPKSAKLENPFSYSQVILTAKLGNGQIIDATRNAKASIEGEAVKLSQSGLIEPIKDGNATLHFELHGQ